MSCNFMLYDAQLNKRNSSMVARYNKAMIILHWLMALCIIGMLAGGLIMTNLEFISISQIAWGDFVDIVFCALIS
jgi:cytochrome b subunit of formate dehydrogenase